MKLPKPIILCYHQTAPCEEVGRRLNVEPATLAAHIKFFKRRRFKFLQARELADKDEQTVCLTFDDAYCSTLTYGLEVLRFLEVPATFFVVPNCVGMSSAWDGCGARQLASWQLLFEAQALGYELGNHTMNHLRLWNMAKAEQRAEWVSAHERFIERGFVPETACYPYGVYSSASCEAIVNLGYKSAFSIDKWPGGNEPMRRARIVVAFGDGIPMLLYKLFLRPRLPG